MHLHQDVAAPELRLNVDRTRLAENGINQRDLANDVMITLASSTQVTPNYWVDPVAGRPYLVAVKTPVHLVDSPDALLRTPIATKDGEPQLLGNLATLERGNVTGSVSHLNIQPVYDVFANVQGRDLGSVVDGINKIIAEFQPQMAPGNTIMVKGLVTNMDSAFARLGLGFIAAIVLVYFLMVVNYQSWLDPFIIIMALPGAFAGIIWALFLTGTTLNVPSLMGAMMAVGVATANSILMVTFANQQMLAGKDSMGAVLTAGSVRLRPVLMTALAMILGMLPMSLALGEGGEQNAPLGRAVIGGLGIATFATLFFVPVVFSLLRKKPNPILAEDTEVPLDALTVHFPRDRGNRRHCQSLSLICKRPPKRLSNRPPKNRPSSAAAGSRRRCSSASPSSSARLLLAGVLPRRAHVQHLEEAAAAQTTTYAVAIAAPGEAAAELVLPSSVEAAQETPLYPRVNGYVKRIAADIGAKVNAGDVLAEIETPELDQQVTQSRAALDQARANFTLATTSYNRWQELQKSKVVSPQDVDERKGALDARKADLAAAQANLQRLEQMQRFQKDHRALRGHGDETLRRSRPARDRRSQ